ncbi:MAG: hypothetical protein ACRD0I_05130, partial [Acidimicrobiales bacterium]
TPARPPWTPDDRDGQHPAIIGRQAGTGLIATVSGVAVFLVLMLLAVQITFDLYARSVVGAAAFDAARIVAGSDASGSVASEAQAEDQARAELGRYANRATFAWNNSPQDITLTVTVHSPTVLPSLVGGPLRLDRVVRTARVRREMIR